MRRNPWCGDHAEFRALLLTYTILDDRRQQDPITIQALEFFEQRETHRAKNARAQYERKMANQFTKDQSRREFEGRIVEDMRLRGNAKSDPRVEHKRRQRTQAEIEAERMADDNMRRAALAGKHKEFVQQEELIANEMEKRKLQAAREEREIQKIRGESEEIRDLEQKLRAAYLSKERAKQVDEKKQLHDNEKHTQALLDLQMEAKRVRDLQVEETKRAQRQQEAVQSRMVLDKQIQEQEDAKQKAYEEFLREKKMVDEIIAKIYVEEQAEQVRQMQKRQETQSYIKKYLNEREQWKAEELRRTQAEDDAIAQYVETVRAREAGWAEKKAALEAEKEKIFQKISEEVTRQRQEQEEMLDLQMELAYQEAEDKHIQAEKERMERRLRARLEMMAANEVQKQMKQERLEAQQREEEEFRQKMLAKFAEDERIEQLNAQKRRMKQQEHRRQVEALLEDRRRMYAAEKEAEQALQEEEAQRQEHRAAVIERERQRILAEHAERLGLDFLPRGLLQKPEDLRFFKGGAAAQERVMQNQQNRSRGRG